VIEYELPDRAAALAIIERRLGALKLGTRLLSSITPAIDDLSQGELVRAADAVVKDAILEGTPKISAKALKQALENRHALKNRFRRHTKS
jgi:AAA+ superfamily predicted ATPase